MSKTDSDVPFLELFVPGRICLFGEHSDWAGGYRKYNPNIAKGQCIVCGTNQGLFARVRAHSSKLLVKSVDHNGKPFTPSFENSMNLHELRNIAQEGNSVIFEFEIPGFDIVGFEYEAKEEDDINKVENALEILSDYKNMIMPSGSAECEKLESSAEVINEGKHSEFISSYRFNCKKISDLKIIYIKYFNNFENSKKLNIKVFGNNKKTAYVITKSKKILNVKDHFDN